MDTRDEITSLELKLDAARVDHDNADIVSDEITNNVVLIHASTHGGCC